MGDPEAPRPEEAPNAADEHGHKSGLWSEADARGGYMTGEYVHGLRQGVWRHFADDGRPRSEGPFLDGLVHGEWTWWRANGRLLQKGGFVREQRHGRWERWTADGTPIDRGDYDHDKKIGEWTAYNPDGTVKKVTNHRPRK
ncbi:toxin-antitoxin system YwqK family antitoxin [Glycomyces paridis]|uniref:Toxin-antitoxin system YwqK family antitoxin n=1 Tax=Glycomyces paridis TaxID=2126555 RepID=A0A4S8P5P8_9ACTN|nr:hypothetical protein [Glycomyces paridis]THV24585.1 hypothetical protein E9998_20490 [Glycomyces paridis]